MHDIGRQQQASGYTVQKTEVGGKQDLPELLKPEPDMMLFFLGGIMFENLPGTAGALGPIILMIYKCGAVVGVVAVLEILTAILVRSRGIRDVLHILYLLGMLAGLWFVVSH